MGQVDGNPIFTIDFDFVDHQLRIHTLDGRAGRSRSRASRSPPSTTRPSRPWPRSGSRWPSPTPTPSTCPTPDRHFADDTEHASYDPAWARRYWQVLSQVNLVLEEFAAWFSGKVSPVHHFWHTFDIAPHPLLPTATSTSPNGRSRDPGGLLAEVISFGFWFGDDRFADPGVLRLHRPGAARPGRPAAATRRPGGIRATAATWPSCAMTTPAPAATPAPPCWTSTRAPIRPAPGWPAGTSGAWPVPAGSLTPGCADSKTNRESRNYLSYRPVEPRRRHALAVISEFAKMNPRPDPRRRMNHAQARALLAGERARLQRLLQAETSRPQPADQGDEVDDADRRDAEQTDSRRPTPASPVGGAGAASTRRLAAGAQGRSIRSGQPIPDERLEADPLAELTVQEAAAAGDGVVQVRGCGRVGVGQPSLRGPRRRRHHPRGSAGQRRTTTTAGPSAEPRHPHRA